MKTIEIPQDENLRLKRKKALTFQRKAEGICALIVAILAVLSLIGALVCLVLTETGERSGNAKTLLYILAGSFTGGAVLFALFALWFSKLSQNAYSAELDYRERCDGENSFFVGDGTLATFEENGIRLHAESGGKEEVTVPYSEMRFFSVCARRAPREKGEWSVVIEIPVKYLVKKRQPAEDEKPALVQTDAKERLYRCLEERGLELLGEKESAGSRKRFVPLKKFIFPEEAARKRALMLIGLGILALGFGIAVALLWQVTVGSIISVVGFFIGGRAVHSYILSKRVLAFYAEGVYWREKASADSVFLKWEEIGTISPDEKNGVSLLKIDCAYGAYHFMNKEGVFEYLKENRPEKCGNRFDEA